MKYSHFRLLALLPCRSLDHSHQIKTLKQLMILANHMRPGVIASGFVKSLVDVAPIAYRPIGLDYIAVSILLFYTESVNFNRY